MLETLLTTGAVLLRILSNPFGNVFQKQLIFVSVLLGHRIFKELGIRKKLIGTAIMIVGSIVIILLKGH